jgi:hypothetical protein
MYVDRPCSTQLRVRSIDLCASEVECSKNGFCKKRYLEAATIC